ncbi:PilZ domain-containing protein [Methylomonas lenta]|uniref:PilZ domain-containing protein n=1 Tax=Methylomonas lenta TaxID=980561 RepID=UPI000B330C89|nr:PilZ domain-containing protein [Methylomonas lenta]
MNEHDKRRCPRLKHRAKIRVFSPTHSEEFFADMRDFSETGVFLMCPADLIPELGASVEVQTTEIEDAPIRSTQVVRIEAGVGFGVEFS